MRSFYFTVRYRINVHASLAHERQNIDVGTCLLRKSDNIERGGKTINLPTNYISIIDP
ncbi:hypothetical protein Q644_02100 [Brucella intermedia 229E]|uniref:Uncharacterized protein n=1 Tax=Brucella intermedia 229E TaxID=1337887 RepID=U4VHT7_9HYPH|nr:hypothetical protein Q644_02100 [Brucella intermedia 229E]